MWRISQSSKPSAVSSTSRPRTKTSASWLWGWSTPATMRNTWMTNTRDWLSCRNSLLYAGKEKKGWRDWAVTTAIQTPYGKLSWASQWVSIPIAMRHDHLLVLHQYIIITSITPRMASPPLLLLCLSPSLQLDWLQSDGAEACLEWVESLGSCHQTTVLLLWWVLLARCLSAWRCREVHLSSQKVAIQAHKLR